MLIDDRRSITNLAHAVLPGLVHFASIPLRLSPMLKKVRWVRIHIPDREILNLNSVRLEGPAPAALDSASVSMSSSYRETTDPRCLLTGKPVHSRLEPFPFWQITFAAGVELRHIEIENRLGAWATRSYSLCVSIGMADGTIQTYENAGRSTIMQRLGEFRSCLNELVQVLAVLPTAQKIPVRPVVATLQDAGASVIQSAEKVAYGTLPSNADTAGRQALLEAVGQLASRLEGASLTSTLPILANLASWLLDRSRRPKEWRPTDEELKALAIIFTDRFIAAGKVSPRFIQENQTFLSSNEPVRKVEDLVNKIYERATSDSSVLPIMFRSHGMSGAELRVNAPKYIASMKEISSLLAEIGYQSGICYGTLLGAVRSGTFIPHDDDVDMAMVMRSAADEELDQELSSIVRLLAEKGVSAKIMPGYRFLKIKAPDGGRSSDVFPIIVKDNLTVRMYMEQLRIRDVPRECVLPFSLLQFYGEEFQAPAVPAQFLAQRYGEDWMTPKRAIASVTMAA